MLKELLKMKLLLFTVLLLSVEAADNCGDRCTSTQVCDNDGTCLEKSSLVKCGSWLSSWYCQKGHECCGYERCMPAGGDCCGLMFYCDIGLKCCGAHCCIAGSFCYNKTCVSDKFSSTNKPLTTWHISVETRAPPYTRYPTLRTTRWFYDYTTRKSYKNYRISYASHFRWWYGVLIGAAVITVAIIIAAVLWNRRKSRSNAPSQSGTVGMAFSAPPQIYGTGTGASGIVLRVPAQTIGQLPKQNMHTMAPNTGVPMHTN